MADRKTLTEWLQFLLAAGIPSDQAANYAVLFEENRITKDMLPELDRTILKELGITALGDCLAIIRHGKSVYSSTAVTPSEIITTVTTQKAATNKAPLVSIKTPTQTVKVGGLRSDKQQYRPKTKLAAITAAVPKSVPVTVEDDDDEYYDDDVVEETSPEAVQVNASAARRKVATPINTSIPPIQITTKQKEEVPVPKKRRVLPEHEGGYKIKMPVGSSVKTAKLIAEGKLTSRTKLTKNERIRSQMASDQISRPGKRQLTVMSALHTSPSNKQNISFTVTGLGKLNPKMIGTLKSASGLGEQPVFKRLGDGGRQNALKRPATSTQSDDEDSISSDAAPYIGVLKDGGIHASIHAAKRAKLGKTTFQVSGLNNKETVKSRLGETQSNVTVSRIGKKGLNSVKDRLGTAGDSTVSSTTDVRPQSKRLLNRNAAKYSKQLATVGLKSQDVFSRLGRR